MPSEQEILENMLDQVDKTLSKEPGGFVYEAIRPVALEIKKSLDKLDTAKEKFDIENLSGTELEKYINQRTGINRRTATHAIGQVTVTGTGSVSIGDLFETESGVRFESLENVTVTGSAIIAIRAVEPGESGNVPSNQINYMPVTLAGIDSVTNTEATYDGFEAEPDADLLARYYQKLRTPATSGNAAHYLNWATEVAGVGDAKVFPLWSGDNTVQVIIINSDRIPASVALVNEVQNYIDPGITGLGDGEAPIGAYVTVDSATGLAINVSFSVTANNATDAEVVAAVEAKLTAHFASIAFKQDYVSYAEIGSIIFNTEEVADYTNLTVNGGTSNVPVAEKEVAVLGGVTLV